MKTKFFLSLALLALLITSCKKDKYQPAGDYVVSGTNSNTVKKYDFTVSVSDWFTSGTNKYYTFYDAAGTDMSGGVMVYYKSTPNYTALPFIVNSTQSMQYVFTDGGTVEIDLVNMPANTYSYRLVIIPPGSRLAHPEVDYTNYEQVKKVFDLKD